MSRYKSPLNSALFLATVFCFVLPGLAQDSNILYPIADIEHRLRYEPFEIFKIRGSRFEGDVTKRVIIRCPDDIYMQVKWKRAASGGWAQNNEPRYELAAYELQKLFLEPEEYVVPPTVARCWPIEQYQRLEEQVEPTFKHTSSVLFVLQYWLEQVRADKIYDKKRFQGDPVYARHLANMNILSYLVEHKDSNIGNFLVSTDPENPRVFAVDNSLAFSSLESNRGVEWKRMRVKRLPKATVERLRKIGKQDLHKTLGVVAQFEIENGQLRPVAAAENLNERKGVRRSDQTVQFGLTASEIQRVYDRLQRLLKRVDSGKIATF